MCRVSTEYQAQAVGHVTDPALNITMPYNQYQKALIEPYAFMQYASRVYPF